MTQKCPAEEIGNNYFSRRSHILMSLLSCPLPTLTSYWSGGFHISQLGLGIGQIVFCFGSIECFYSDTSRWPSDNCNFLCVILFGGKFLVCVLLYNRNILITKTGHFWNCVKLKDQLAGEDRGWRGER